MREHRWNSYSQENVKVGGTTPVLCDVPLKRQYGATVVNNLMVGEKVAAGTPIEFDLATRTAKFLKAWKIKATEVSDSNTIVTLYKTVATPKLNSNTAIMVMPSTLKGTGKAAYATAITETENTYVVTLATASFDSLAVNGFLVEAKEIGSGKAIYCQPNLISIEDTVKGTEATLVDLPRGHVYMYQNTIPAMPEVVKSALNNNDIQISWEMYNED